MSDDTEGAVFPGSQGAANVVGWIDRVLLDLREGRLRDARALLEDEGWRSLDMGGLPHPILHQLAEALDEATAALAGDGGGDAEAALLTARARFLPGG